MLGDITTRVANSNASNRPSAGKMNQQRSFATAAAVTTPSATAAQDLAAAQQTDSAEDEEVNTVLTYAFE